MRQNKEAAFLSELDALEKILSRDDNRASADIALIYRATKLTICGNGLVV